MKFLDKICCLIAVAIILALFVLVAHAAVPCSTEIKKHWRLVDGRKCYVDKFYKKSSLYWPRGSSEVRRSVLGDGDRVQFPAAPTPSDEIELPKHLLVHELVAQLQTAQLEVEPPRQTRIVLASPLLPVDIIPLPRPRPRFEDPPGRPIYAPQWGLLLALLLIGNAATDDHD